jgi:hypothetical protein
MSIKSSKWSSMGIHNASLAARLLHINNFELRLFEVSQPSGEDPEHPSASSCFGSFENTMKLVDDVAQDFFSRVTRLPG